MFSGLILFIQVNLYAELVKSHPRALTAAAKVNLLLKLLAQRSPVNVGVAYWLCHSITLQDWVQAYQQSRGAATAELLTLLTQVMNGCMLSCDAAVLRTPLCGMCHLNKTCNLLMQLWSRPMTLQLYGAGKWVLIRGH